MSSSQVEPESFLSDILKPGSSTNPTFLFIVDCALGSLLVVLLSLSYLTSGNYHIFALTAIELALWVSIKWFVNELKNMPNATAEEEKEVEGSKKQI